jgi:hypothetical protein
MFIYEGVWKDTRPTNRTRFKSDLPLKDAIDTLVFRFDGSHFSAEEERQVLIPEQRFINPAGTGSLVVAASVLAQYAVRGVDLEYESIWPKRRPRHGFERLSIGLPDDRSELFLYANALFTYAEAGEYRYGAFTKVSSEDKILERVLDEFAMRLPEEERANLSGVSFDSLRA